MPWLPTSHGSAWMLSKNRCPKSNKSWMSILVLEPALTWGSHDVRTPQFGARPIPNVGISCPVNPGPSTLQYRGRKSHADMLLRDPTNTLIETLFGHLNELHTTSYIYSHHTCFDVICIDYMNLCISYLYFVLCGGKTER